MDATINEHGRSDMEKLATGSTAVLNVSKGVKIVSIISVRSPVVVFMRQNLWSAHPNTKSDEAGAYNIGDTYASTQIHVARY
jgi:hypothetical protein